jgi:hypothetical protein
VRHGLDEFVLAQPVGQRQAQVAVELLRAVHGDQRSDGFRLRSRGDKPGRFQSSPNRTSSVNWTSFGAKSPSSCWARVCFGAIGTILDVSARAQSNALEPRLDGGAAILHLLALHREALTDGRARA